MKILLAGASGFIGRNLMSVLTRDGHAIQPVSRRHGVDLARMQTPDRWLPYLKDVDAVVNAVGIIGETRTQRFDVLHATAPMALFDACARAGVSRVVQISALGADDTAFSRYHRSKKTADDHLRSLDVDWFVLRPSVIYGPGGSSSALFLRLASLPVLPVIGDGRQRLQPVHIADVVDTVRHCLSSPRPRQTLDIVGNEDIEFVEWLQRLRMAQGHARAAVLRLPVWTALAGAWFGRPFSAMARPENIRMLTRGYLGDGDPWRRFLGRSALDFSPDLLQADAARAIEGLGSTT